MCFGYLCFSVYHNVSTALLRHVSRWLWRALVARLQALDASLVVALRQSLATFAGLASEQGQVLAALEASHRVTLEQQVLNKTTTTTMNES